MCIDGLVQLLMTQAKPRTKLVRTNRNAYYMLIMLMLPKVSVPLLNRIYVLIWIKIHVICITVAEIENKTQTWTIVYTQLKIIVVSRLNSGR